MSHILIDGYNLLAQSKYASREELLAQIKHYLKINKHKVTIFFDGTHQGTGYGDKYFEEHIEIIFSALTITADDEMIDYIDQKHSTNMIVVSSDRKIQKAASAKRLPYLEAKEFLFKLKYVPSSTTQSRQVPWLEGRTTDEEHPRKQKKGNPQKKSKKERQKNRSFKKL